MEISRDDFSKMMSIAYDVPLAPFIREYYLNMFNYIKQNYANDSRYKEYNLNDDSDENIKDVSQNVLLQFDDNENFFVLDALLPIEDDKLIDSGLIKAIDQENNSVVVTKKLGKGDQNVYFGVLYRNNEEPLEVVVKWGTLNESVNNEIQNWTDFIATYTSKGQVPDTPYIDDNFKIYGGYKIMVIEKLQPISKEDDVQQLGIQILDQLQHLHEIGCHSDIKPDNILKRVTNSGTKFFLIDMGLIARKRYVYKNKSKSYGYIREGFTPSFTSQIEWYISIITPKYDLVELGFVLNWMTVTMAGFRQDRYDAEMQRSPYMAKNYWRYLKPDNDYVMQYITYIESIPENTVDNNTYTVLKEQLSTTPTEWKNYDAIE